MLSVLHAVFHNRASVDYEQSLSFLGPSSKMPETQMTTRKTEGARVSASLVSRGFAAQRSRACTPLTKSEEKERLLAV